MEGKVFLCESPYSACPECFLARQQRKRAINNKLLNLANYYPFHNLAE